MEKPHHLQWGRAGTSDATGVELKAREALLPATSNPGGTATSLGSCDLTLTRSSLSLNCCSLPLSFLSWPSTRQSFWILLPTSCPSPGLNSSPLSHPSSRPLLGSNLSSPCCSNEAARHPSPPPSHTRTHTHTCTHIHTHTHTHTNTYTHTHTRTYTHSHTHTHTGSGTEAARHP